VLLRLRPLLAVALVAAVLPASGAAAAQKHARGLHNARYCEILELKGTLPNAQAVVWNTIKLNTCPAAWWRSLDAPSLATELGDTFVVLNGPRHFLMDAASAVTGRVRAFHGQRLTRVAALPIHTAAQLSQTPYAERTVSRTNTWEFNKGRRIFELVGPGDRVYVMQSYAQIKDPSLTIGDLPGLGSRLALPTGWRYRARTLRHRFVLAARGSATILQDDLQDTYQLVKPAH
jgi:hypothetical protein